MALDTLKPDADILNQEEIERLLAQVAQEAAQATIHKAGGAIERCPRDSLQPHDFRAPSFLTPNQWRKLRLEHEDFANALAGRLSNYLRLEATLRVAKLETESYERWINERAEPTHLVLFKLEPMRGICLLDIHPHLGLTLVDRLMGGPGQASSLSRDLSDIEIALLDQPLAMVLNEWCQRWAKLQDLRPAILGHETSGRYLQTAAATAMLLVLTLEVRVSNCAEELTLAFPCSTLEPLLRQMTPALEPAPPADKARPAPTKPKWNPDLNTVLVPVAAQWPERPLSARQLTQLKVGDVLEWDPVAANEVRLRLAKTAKFIGRLGTKDGKWAVEITARLPKAD